MDYQQRAWDDFSKTGKAVVGRETLIGLTYDWEEDVADEARVSGEFGFYAGFNTADERLCDQCNIPEEVFEEMFDGVLGVKFEWNAAEAYHCAKLDPKKMDDFLTILKTIFEKHGFTR